MKETCALAPSLSAVHVCLSVRPCSIARCMTASGCMEAWLQTNDVVNDAASDASSYLSHTDAS